MTIEIEIRQQVQPVLGWLQSKSHTCSDLSPRMVNLSKDRIEKAVQISRNYEGSYNGDISKKLNIVLAHLTEASAVGTGLNTVKVERCIDCLYEAIGAARHRVAA